jgi:hypothetical protein
VRRNIDGPGFILIDPETNDTVAMGLVTETGSTAGNIETTLIQLRTPAQRVLPRPKLPATASDTPTRCLAKAVSWRAAGSLGTFALMFFITGSAVFAGATAEIVT